MLLPFIVKFWTIFVIVLRKRTKINKKRPRFAPKTTTTKIAKMLADNLYSSPGDLLLKELQLPLHLGTADHLVHELPLEEVHVRVHIPELDYPQWAELVHARISCLGLVNKNNLIVIARTVPSIFFYLNWSNLNTIETIFQHCITLQKNPILYTFMWVNVARLVAFK